MYKYITSNISTNYIQHKVSNFYLNCLHTHYNIKFTRRIILRTYKTTFSSHIKVENCFFKMIFPNMLLHITFTVEGSVAQRAWILIP